MRIQNKKWRVLKPSLVAFDFLIPFRLLVLEYSRYSFKTNPFLRPSRLHSHFISTCVRDCVRLVQEISNTQIIQLQPATHTDLARYARHKTPSWSAQLDPTDSGCRGGPNRSTNITWLRPTASNGWSDPHQPAHKIRLFSQTQHIDPEQFQEFYATIYRTPGNQEI